MKLNNSALQELYDAIVKSTITILPYTESPIDKAFRECDEKLSGLLVFEHIKSLEKDLDDAKNQLKYFTQSRNNWRSRAHHAEDEVDELKATLEKANTRLTELLNDRNFYQDLYVELNSIYEKDPDYESCFTAMIDGFETVELPYLRIVFR